MRVQRGESVVVVTDPFDDTPSAVTATVVRRSTGATLTAPATAVSGQRVTVTLTAATHTTLLDTLDVTVNATVASLPTVQRFTVDVVGGHWVTLAALRDEPSLADVSRFPDPLLAAFRDEVCDFVEEACRRAFTPRWAAERRIGDGTSELVLWTSDVRGLRAVTVDGVTQAVGDFDVLPGDVIRWNAGVFTSGKVVEVSFEHGWDRPPGQLVREVIGAVRTRVLARGAQAPRDLLWEQTADGMTVRYATADPVRGRWTGLQHLDAAIEAWRDRTARLGIA